MLKTDVTRARLLALAESEGLATKPPRMQCPARCSEDPRAATVQEPQGYALWECKRCGAAGDAVSFLEHARGLSAADALQALADLDSLPAIKPPAPRRKIDPLRVWERCAATDPAGIAYLRTRGLERAAELGLVRFNAGSTGERWLNERAAEGYRVAMPLYAADGTLASLQLRATGPTPDPKKTKLALPGHSTTGLAFGSVQDARTAPVVHITEGIADTLAVLLAGHVAIGAPGADLVPHLAAHVGAAAGRTFILCRQRDPDPRAQAVGDRRFGELAAALQTHGAEVRQVYPPEPHKDPAEVLQHAGIETLRAYLAEAPPDPLEQAREIVRALPKRLADEPGAAVEPASLAALALLEAQDPPAFANAMHAIGRVKGLARLVGQNLKRAKAPAASAPDPTTVGEALPNAPEGARELRIPKGYYLGQQATGTLSVGVSLDPAQPPPITRTPIATAPVLITMRHRDEEAGVELLRLAWRRHGRWYHRVVPREQVMGASKLLDLAAAGFPVHTANHKELSLFLAEFEAENDAALRGPRISTHLGWQGRKPGEGGFLVGRAYVPADGAEPVALDLEDLPAEWSDDWVAFRGPDTGDEQIADAFRPAGSMEGWLDAIAPLADHPRALIALYTSFVPPLLEILGARNFVVDFAGRTSLGKTTALRAAASVWGDPDESSPASTLASWDATRVAVERRGALLSSLPLIVDDTKRARSAKDVAAVLYAVANGRGRDRGSTRGTAATRAWKTVMLSSGEQPAVDFTEDGGTRGRCLVITGSPFGGEGPETRAVVDHVNRQVRRHHGHAGLAWIRAILQRRGEWPAWRERFEAREEEIATVLASGVGARIGGYVAAIETTADLLHQLLPLPFPLADAFASLWPEIIAAIDEAPPEVRALQALGSWIAANEEKFLERGKYEPSGGWAGVWPPGQGWEYVALYPHAYRAIITQLGFEPGAVLEAARGRGWLICDAGHHTRRIVVGGSRKRMLAFSRVALAEVGAVEPAGPGPGDQVDLVAG